MTREVSDVLGRKINIGDFVIHTIRGYMRVGKVSTINTKMLSLLRVLTAKNKSCPDNAYPDACVLVPAQDVTMWALTGGCSGRCIKDL